MSLKLHCFSCQAVNEIVDRVGRRDECDKCGADLHVCKNCQFYDPKAYNECREPQADVVLEKERANYCDYFSPSSESRGVQDVTDSLKAAAEALFKKN